MGGLIDFLNELTLGSLQYALTGRQTDGDKITLWNLVPNYEVINFIEKTDEEKLNDARRGAAMRGLVPVIVWLAALLGTILVSDSDGVGTSSRALLVGSDGTKADDNLSNSWYSVLGFNVMQLILLVSAGALIPIKKQADRFYQWQRQWKWAENLPWPLKELKNLVISLFSSNLVQIARLGVDLGFFFVSAAAVWYSLEAFSNLSNIQPDGSRANDDARDALIKVFGLVALQILVILRFRERDAGKSEKSPKLLESLANTEDLIAAKQEGPENKAGIGGVNLDFSAKERGLKIHNFY